MKNKSKSHLKVAMVDGVVVMSTTCPICGKRNREIHVDPDQYDMYVSGVSIQDSFPQLSVDDCEMIKTGYCENCWDHLFDKKED